MQNPNIETYKALLKELLSFPSISGLPEFQNDTILAGEFIEREFRKMGFKTSLHNAKSHEKEPPIVVARKITNPNNPTILFYCHYDVQPAEEAGWNTDPFEPIEKNGHIYARGSIDDKGPLVTVYGALADLQNEWHDNWPINIVCLFDGQEESASANLTALFEEKDFQELFKVDAAILVDGLFADSKTPAVTYGLRGLAYFRVHIKRGDFDVHSGLFGGAVLNPMHVLGDIISKLYDTQTGKILLPGFYDTVENISEEERALLAKTPLSQEEFLKSSGNTKEAFGEKNYSIKEQTSARPSFDVNGIWGGYMGEATKTVVPAEVFANMSFRLVPHQKSEEIEKLFYTFIDSLTYSGISIEITPGFSAEPVKSAVNSKWNTALADALEETFQVKPIFDRMGGSGAEASLIKNYLGIDPVFIGYARPEDNYHGINEKLSLELFEKGIEANKLILKKFAEIKR